MAVKNVGNEEETGSSSENKIWAFPAGRAVRYIFCPGLLIRASQKDAASIPNAATLTGAIKKETMAPYIIL
jgi:hypothetical protein